MTDVISVRFRSGCKEYYFDPKGLTIPAETDVIVETARARNSPAARWATTRWRTTRWSSPCAP